MQLDGKDFPQAEFAYYIQRCPFSTKRMRVNLCKRSMICYPRYRNDRRA